MKKIYLLFVAATLAACSAESIETEGPDSLDAAVAGKSVNAQNGPNNEKEKLDSPSILFVSSSDSTINFNVVAGETGAPGGFDIHWQLVQDPLATVDWENENACEAGFASNKNNSYALGANGTFPLELGALITQEECGSDLLCGMVYAVRVRAKKEGGHPLEKSEWSENFFLSTEDCSECPSGYMIGDKDFSKIGTSKNWGWAHKFEFNGSGSETREIHHKNGSLGGEVTIAYENGNVTITEGQGVTITHLYVSNEEPTETNAPGQFDKTQEFEDEDGTFWVIVKAEVCQQE